MEVSGSPEDTGARPARSNDMHMTRMISNDGPLVWKKLFTGLFTNHGLDENILPKI